MEYYIPLAESVARLHRYRTRNVKCIRISGVFIISQWGGGENRKIPKNPINFEKNPKITRQRQFP